jgi:cellulose synthase/poly-beta-1,6-N-acetylglucosamine synthase-like glycosyltransferase
MHAYLERGMGEVPKISIVTAFDNFDDYDYDDRDNLGFDRPMLSLIVESLANQTVSPASFEFVAINPSTRIDWRPVFDGSMNRLGRNKGLNFRFYDVARGGRGFAHNCGIERAQAPLVAFLAGDFIPEANFVESHLDFHRRHPEREAIGIGPGVFPALQREDDFCRWLEDSGTIFGVSFTGPNVTVPEHFFCVANVSAKKQFLIEAGLFDNDFPYSAWDDYEMGLRLRARGMKSYYVSDAIAVHRHNVNFQGRQTSMRRAGESACIFERKYPGRQPWHKTCRRSPSMHQLRASLWKAGYALSGQQRWREKYYQSTLDAAFSAAYREARHAAQKT